MINSGPEHFPDAIAQSVRGPARCVCLMDDIVVYGNLKEHDERRNQVFERLSKAKIILNKEKCWLRKPEIFPLGQSVGNDGVKLDPAKVSAVVGIEAPQNVGEFREFLGMVNQLGKF